MKKVGKNPKRFASEVVASGEEGVQLRKEIETFNGQTYENEEISRKK